MKKLYVYKDKETPGQQDMFVYWNNNPRGEENPEDQPFQIIKAFSQSLSDKEIIKRIIRDLIKHGLAQPDHFASSRLIRDNLKLKEIKTCLTLSDFIERHKEDDWLIIHLGDRVELFNKGKIYGHAPIFLDSLVTGYFKPEVTPCLK